MPRSFAWDGDIPQLLSVTIAIDFIVMVLLAGFAYSVGVLVF